jgi:hypothetical protein
MALCDSKRDPNTAERTITIWSLKICVLGLVLDPWSSCCRQWGQHGAVGTEQDRTRYSRGDLQLQQLCAGFMAGVVM